MKYLLLVPVALLTMAAGWYQMQSPPFSPSPAVNVLPVEQAFVISHERHAGKLRIHVSMAPDAYLYRHRLRLDGEGVTLGDWQLPAGEPHSDAYFGQSQIYRRQLTLELPLQNEQAGARIELSYQGCATGLCYPPQQRSLPLP